MGKIWSDPSKHMSAQNLSRYYYQKYLTTYSADLPKIFGIFEKRSHWVSVFRVYKHWTGRKINLSSNKSIGTTIVDKKENSLLIEMIICASALIICRNIKLSMTYILLNGSSNQFRTQRILIVHNCYHQSG